MPAQVIKGQTLLGVVDTGTHSVNGDDRCWLTRRIALSIESLRSTRAQISDNAIAVIKGSNILTEPASITGRDTEGSVVAMKGGAVNTRVTSCFIDVQ